MKNKLWLFNLPIVIALTGLFWVTHLGERGDLKSGFLRQELFPYLKTISGNFTNIKFKLRGPREPKEKVVVLAIDDDSVEQIGRWPWSRDYMAVLIKNTLDLGAKIVGLDVVFSERDQRVPDELKVFLSDLGLSGKAEEYETDPALTQVFDAYSDQVVLGWATDSHCQPAYDETCAMGVQNEQVVDLIPEGIQKFGFDHVTQPEGFSPQKTPVVSMLYFISNLPEYNAVARHAGSFNVTPDPDGYVRRTTLFFLSNGVPLPILPLAMARAGLKEELTIGFNEKHKVSHLGFKKSGRSIPITPLGTLEINFRGARGSYDYVSALDVLTYDPSEEAAGRGLASTDPNKTLKERLKDAYVLVGPSAVGIYDMRAFPFDSNVPGVEGHATILGNLLSGDALIPGSLGFGWVWILLLMTVGSIAFAFLTEKLESIPALLLFVFTIGGIGFFDLKVLFSNQTNWNTSFLYIELGFIFVFTLALKYVLEERGKKFLKGAFGKYVSPAVVDSIVKDPEKLSLGGDKKELSVFFSDIRGFTTLSEKMDAKQLAKFLNDYLGTMTELVFEHRGTLDKYIGDAVMAFWGAPIDQKDHAWLAVQSAIAQMQALEKARPRYKKDYDIDVQIGIGINSGTVNVGNMGSEDNFNYTVIGDDVNLAARLEGLTKPYGASILTTRNTFDDIESSGKPFPPHRTLDFVIVKGKKQAVEIIQVLEKEKSQNGLKIFEEARTLYTQQKWDEAIEGFKQANEILKDASTGSDGPSLMFIERCEEFKNNPPPSDWDGAWVMTSK